MKNSYRKFINKLCSRINKLAYKIIDKYLSRQKIFSIIEESKSDRYQLETDIEMQKEMNAIYIEWLKRFHYYYYENNSESIDKLFIEIGLNKNIENSKC